MKKINEMMISAYLKGMSKLNAFKDNESGEVNMVAIVLIIIVVIALVAVFKDGILMYFQQLLKRSRKLSKLCKHKLKGYCLYGNSSQLFAAG